MSHHNQAQKRATTAAVPPPPRAPPLPAPRPLQRARDAASRFLGYTSRPPSPQGSLEDDRFTHGSSAFTRSSSIGETQNATTSHKTGLEVKTLSINDSGSHAVIAGKEIFKTIRVQDGTCAEDFNIRSAIRSTPTHASGQPRQIYSIDIADVAWAKGESGDYVAAATSSGKIIVYDLGHAGLQAAQLHEHYRQVHNITFNPHRGSLLLSGSQDGTVRLWDLRDLRNPRSQGSTIQSRGKLPGLSDGVRDVKWSPVEGYDFAFCTDNGEVQRWDMRNLQKPKVKIPAHRFGCNTVDWHPDGKHILTAGSDQTARVFDVSTNRPRKASWEIKTAYPVMQARWRPSCQSIMPQDQGAQQCTQIVTSYGKERPVMHIWDFRRPWLPFRELRQPYDTAPVDMLWHSQDLLWTVGGGAKGWFLQQDIKHSPKVIDRCNLQAFDVSPLGELSFIAQARKQRRTPRLQHLPDSLQRTSSSLSTSPDSSVLSRSWADDCLDQSFLRTLPFKPKHRSSSNSRVHGSLSTSPYGQKQSATLKLDEVLLNRKSFRPQQLACRGQLPSQHQDPTMLAMTAERLEMEIPSTSTDEEFLDAVEKAFNNNEESAHNAGLLIIAQTWKLVGHCTLTHIRDRLALKRKRLTQKHLPAQAPFRSSIESLATRLAAQHLKSPTQSPGTMRPLSTIAQQLAVPESTSNVPTPLARPSSRGHHNGSRLHQPLPDPDQDEQVVLPPSLASAHASPPPEPTREPAKTDRRLTFGNLEDLQKLESFRDNSDRHDRVKRWNTQSKEPLDLDPVDADGVKIPLSKFDQYGSGESFQFLEESTGSRGSSFPASLESKGSPVLKMPAAHPTRSRLPDGPNPFPIPAEANDLISSAHQSMFFEGSGTLANSALMTQDNSKTTSLEASTEDLKAARKIEATDFAFAGLRNGNSDDVRREQQNLADNVDCIDVDDSDSPPGKNGMRHPKEREANKRISSQAGNSIKAHTDGLSPVDSVMDDDDLNLEMGKPWTLVEMLQQLLRYYTAEEPYAQMASALLLLCCPLLPRTHSLAGTEIEGTVSIYMDYFAKFLDWDPEDVPYLVARVFEQPLKAGLQPLQIEAILATYHEQLLVHQLFNEAAALRKLAYPAYPAVYEDFIKDNSIHLMCGQCRKPIREHVTSMRCQSCQHKQAGCPICWEKISPYEIATGSNLLTSCLLCGHGGHASCLEEWFVNCGGDSCPTEGCLCDCVAGAWRNEKASLQAEKKADLNGPQQVKTDEWKAKESEAVEGVRKLM